MDRGFQKWLSKRGLQPGTIAILEKESILHESTFKLLSLADLEVVRKKHHITMGQFAVLRSLHGDLLETEGDGFEIVEMGEVPTLEELAATGRGGGGGRRDSTGERYRVQEKKQVSVCI